MLTPERYDHVKGEMAKKISTVYIIVSEYRVVSSSVKR